MKFLQLGALGMLAAAVLGSHAQTPFPPPALAAANSVEAATGALGATKAEFSTHLLLDVPEVSLAGRVEARLVSELPGTSMLVLLRQFPAAAQPSRSLSRTHRAGSAASGATVPAAPSVLVAAIRVEPGERPVLSTDFDFARSERFTLLAFAQGRWFFTFREIKVARKPEDQ